MHRSTSSGCHAGLLEEGHRAEEVGEEQPVDHEARQVGDLDGRLAQRVAQIERARRRVASVAAAGKASSTSFIFGTGLKTCRPTKRSDMPVARARRSTDSEDVVVARIASSPATRPRSARTPDLTVSSSATASMTAVASPSASRSVSTRTWAGVDLAAQAPADRVDAAARPLARSRWSAPTARPRRAGPPPPRGRTRSGRCPLSRVVHARCDRSWLTGQSMAGNVLGTGVTLRNTKGVSEQ